MCFLVPATTARNLSINLYILKFIILKFIILNLLYSNLLCSNLLCSNFSPTIEGDVGKRIESPHNWIDYAMTKYGGTYEESDIQEVKYLLNLMALFLCLIPYWIVYAQVIKYYVIVNFSAVIEDSL